LKQAHVILLIIISVCKIQIFIFACPQNKLNLSNNDIPVLKVKLKAYLCQIRNSNLLLFLKFILMTKNQNSIDRVLQNINIDSLNEMQQNMLKTIEEKSNVLLLSPTGTGKTLGFLLPLVDLLDEKETRVQAMILAPSRELALQIEQVFKSMGIGFKVNCCYGGHDMQIEKNNLSQPPAVLIGTPGRIVDHIRNGRIDTSAIKTLVLDEYDKCLEFGFTETISYIMKVLPNLTRRILTSATPAIEIHGFIGLTNPVTLNYLTNDAPENLNVKIVDTPVDNRLDTLFRLVCKIGNRSTLIFCNQRDTVDQISSLLWDKGVPNNVFHGGLDQTLRERTLIKFRNGSHSILVTTDLASRGLDIPEIEHIIHYNLPENEKVFTHRNGRTARMHASGTSYLLVNERETVPSFLKEKPAFENLPSKAIIPAETDWVTLYISAGKKEKISKMDIAGLLMQKGKLNKDEVGLIDVLDHVSYVAVKRTKVEQLLEIIGNAPIKKQKVKIEVAR
jgi:superfamily II DNA/RNA helicase